MTSGQLGSCNVYTMKRLVQYFERIAFNGSRCVKWQRMSGINSISHQQYKLSVPQNEVPILRKLSCSTYCCPDYKSHHCVCTKHGTRLYDPNIGWFHATEKGNATQN